MCIVLLNILEGVFGLVREWEGGGPNGFFWTGFSIFAPWEGQLNFLKFKLNVNQRNQRINVQPFWPFCINFFSIISWRPCSKSPGIVEKQVPIIPTFSESSNVRVLTKFAFEQFRREKTAPILKHSPLRISGKSKFDFWFNLKVFKASSCKLVRYYRSVTTIN